MRNYLILAFASFAFLISCNDNNVEQVSTKEPIILDESSFAISGLPFQLPSGVTISEVPGRIVISKNVFRPTPDLGLNQEFTTSSFYGVFFNDLFDYGIDAGSVTLNGIEVNRSQSGLDAIVPGSTDTTFAYQSFDDLYFNSTNYSIQGTGSGYFPPFNINVVSPSNEVQITSHSNLQSVSKGQDLTVNWNFTPDSTHVIFVSLNDFNNGPGVKFFTKETDYLKFTKNELSNLKNGEVELSVEVYTYSLEPLGNGEYILAYCVSSDSIWLYVTN